MNKYTVVCTRIPTNYNDPRSLVIEAESEKDAVMLAKHHLRDLGGIANYAYYAEPYVAPPVGKVIG